MAYINSTEPVFHRLGSKSIKEKYIELLQDVKHNAEECDHEYGEPVYDPEEIVYYNITRERWHVDCKKCGRRQYTYTKEMYMKRK